MKTITLRQSGHEIDIKILVANIKRFYKLTYKSGQVVTVIEHINGDESHVLNSLSEVENLINKS